MIDNTTDPKDTEYCILSLKLSFKELKRALRSIQCIRDREFVKEYTKDLEEVLNDIKNENMQSRFL